VQQKAGIRPSIQSLFTKKIATDLRRIGQSLEKSYCCPYIMYWILSIGNYEFWMKENSLPF